MKANILTLAITLTIGVILAGSLLVPVINDASEVNRTFTNSGIYYMTDLSDEESITYTFDGTDWTIDGEPADIVATDQTTLVAGDGFIIRSNGNIPGIASPKSITSLTVDADGIAMSYVKTDDTTATYSKTATVYYCAVNEKTATVLSENNSAVYVKSNTDLVVETFSGTASGLGTIFLVEGNIADGFTVTPLNTDVTVGDVTCNYVQVDGFNDLYKVTSITFESTHNDTVRTQTFTSFIAPSEVTAERSQHLDSGEIAIMAAIPILVIVGLLIVGVNAIRVKD